MRKGILITSFGTTYEETRRLCIESIENKIKEEFKDYHVARAFTSRIVISRLKERDKYFVDNPGEALEKMKDLGIKEILIQPLLIIEGIEYEKILKEAGGFLEENHDIRIKIGKPLLSSNEDYKRVIKALKIGNDKPMEATIFMGHGSDHKADISYQVLEDEFRKEGYENAFIATVEGEKTLDDIIVSLYDKKINRVKLKPLMLVAGDHASNDMASNEEDSWKSILEKNDIRVDVEIQGLGQIRAIQDIFVDHLKEIID